MNRPRAELALPSPRAARRCFDRARDFAGASVVHGEIRRRLLERLPFYRIDPRTVVDLGCALGEGARALGACFPHARVLGVDWSPPLLAQARALEPGAERIAFLAGDAHLLPLRSHAVDLVFANLVLPWCAPPLAFAEAARVLRDGGLLLFATLGPDTLQELRRAWAAVDDRVHVHAAFDMHDLADLALRAGLAEPVVDVDRIQVSYPDIAALVAELRACGAVNTAAGRRRSLTGRRRWEAFARRLEAGRNEERIAVTLEVIIGHAWGRGAAPERVAAPRGGEVGIAVDRIGRRPPSPK